jgi:hypothetical protein
MLTCSRFPTRLGVKTRPNVHMGQDSLQVNKIFQDLDLTFLKTKVD